MSDEVDTSLPPPPLPANDEAPPVPVPEPQLAPTPQEQENAADTDQEMSPPPLPPPEAVAAPAERSADTEGAAPPVEAVAEADPEPMDVSMDEAPTERPRTPGLDAPSMQLPASDGETQVAPVAAEVAAVAQPPTEEATPVPASPAETPAESAPPGVDPPAPNDTVGMETDDATPPSQVKATALVEVEAHNEAADPVAAQAEAPDAVQAEVPTEAPVPPPPTYGEVVAPATSAEAKTDAPEEAKEEVTAEVSTPTAEPEAEAPAHAGDPVEAATPAAEASDAGEAAPSVGASSAEQASSATATKVEAGQSATPSSELENATSSTPIEEKGKDMPAAAATAKPATAANEEEPAADSSETQQGKANTTSAELASESSAPDATPAPEAAKPQDPEAEAQQPRTPAQQYSSGPSAAGSAAAAAAAPAAQPQPMRELKVEDALLYLDQVKLEFGDRPRIYNEFLEIMKNFKAQEIDTPGVIRRVSTLFRGYNNLILGFNTFLPEGYKIELKDLEQGGAYAAPAPPPPPPGHMYSQQQVGAAAGRPPVGGMGRGVPPQQQQQQQQQSAYGRGGPAAAAGHPYQQAGRPAGPPPQQRPQLQPAPPMQQQQQAGGPQAVEFDHAIAYVTTIKKRFANDPRTYQTFLEILHTYQKEQRGIKEVLEQVSNLFADHPDLLKEFTFFLPDAVQEQAKERLQRAAAEAEERKRIMLQQQAAAAAQQRKGRKGQQDYGVGRTPPPPPPGTQKFIDMTQPGKGMPSSPRKKRGYDGQVAGQPAEVVYNAGVERQFFDAAKEALTSYSRDGGQAWAEFLKCLDMYAQEVLSRSEMLGFVEPLLGKRNTELFEEFKRILASAGAPNGPAADDSWHSVPLSEIDFSRCRRCSPSYRALPRDYPAPPCSERNPIERKVLNDVWVSLPVGSEESYTFRHMRKNQHEEILFRIEDERFEIDMCIDSNAVTLLRLEPIAEEIAQINAKELTTPKYLTAVDIPGKKSGPGKGSISTDTGFAGKKFQYMLDKPTLTTIHRHSIVRIYGDAGEEMFDLLFNNPTVAVPVIVKRLRQKDKEWRAARTVLNLRWKELAGINYYKSLDHQSMTWRTADKRATSTRTLVGEIKDRAVNNGEESDAAVSARRDKMKEEYGSFYEVTMGRYSPRRVDLSKVPNPTPSLFTPHLSLMYENTSWAQKDAYRILTYSLERGSISPMDKEKCHRMWTDFLSHMFGLSMAWMQDPARSYASAPHSAPTVVSNDESGDDDESSKSDEDNGSNHMDDDVDVTEEIKDTKSAGEVAVVGDFDGMGFLLDQQPIPFGTIVSTTYGEGTIKNFRKADSIYEVEFKGGIGYIRPDSILSTVFSVAKSTMTEQLRPGDNEEIDVDRNKFIVGTQSLYLFFRLHHILVQRLATAKELAYKSSKDRSIRTHIEQMTSDSQYEDIGAKRYNAFLSMVYGVIEGAYSSSSGANEGGKFEERVRCLLGQNAFELATIDKLVSHIQKHLQHMAGDETMRGMVDIYRRHVKTGSFKPNAFKQEAAYISEGENMFAFQYCTMNASDKAVMHYEFLGDIAESDSEDDGEEEEEDVDMDDASGAEAEVPTSKRQRRA